MNNIYLESPEYFNGQREYLKSDFFVTKNYEEVTIHGSKEFPMAVYSVQLSQCILHRTPLHWHKEIQFICVKQGDMSVKVDDKIYRVSEGEGLFINSQHLHFSYTDSSKDCTYLSVDVSPSFFANQNSIIYEKYLNNLFCSSKISSIFLSSKEKWQLKILEHIVEINDVLNLTEPGFELKACSLIHDMMYELIKNGDSRFTCNSNIPTNNDKKIKTMISYIENNYNNKISLEDISNSCNISRSECCREFKRTLNVTPFQYLISYRITKSILLIKNTTMNITDIALDVGFVSTSYFIEKFKDETGYTPLQFRKYALPNKNLQKLG